MSIRLHGVQTVSRDCALAVRTLWGNPTSTATALIALMLGIGANTAVFSVVNAVLLKPVPFPEPDRLVMLMISANHDPVLPVASPAQFVYWSTQTDVLDDVAAFRSTTLDYTAGGIVDPINATEVSQAYFRTFRARIVQGRGFTADEELPRGPRVAVLSHAFWSKRLGADPEIIGKTISLSGAAYTIVGVVGPDFDVREQGDPEIWLPLRVDRTTTARAYIYRVAARLKPGVTLAQAQDRLEASAATFREEFPGVLGPRAGFSALTMREAIAGKGVRKTLLVLLGAVGLVLLIACANVANLLLIRANERRRQIAIRSALGATRGRIAQQLLSESVLLSLAGGTLGLLAGFLGMRALLAVDTAGLPRLGEAGSLVHMDWRVVSFTLALSLGTVLLFGLSPALAASRANLVELTKGTGSRAGGSIRQSRTRSALITVEVALSVVLLIGAALLIRTSLALSQVDPGFDTRNLLTMRTSLSGPEFAATESIERLVSAARERIRSIPGVVDAVATCCAPMQPGWGAPFDIPGRSNEGLYTGSNAVVSTSPGYFAIFKIPVLRGRPFNGDDRAGAPPVAIVNEAFAKQYWPKGADAPGHRLLIGGGAANMRQYADEPVRQIVGVVGNIRATGLAEEPKPVIYVPQAQLPDALSEFVASSLPTTWIVRTQSVSPTVSQAVQKTLRVTSGVPVTDVRKMDDIVSRSVSRQRLNMLLMSVFAGAALVLAAIGIFGIVAYAVQQRTQEIGIRMALGASSNRMRAMAIRQGMMLVSIGLAVGLITAYYLANVLASFLFDVQPHDLIAFTTVPATLLAVALAAVIIPAARASRIDPLHALRYE